MYTVLVFPARAFEPGLKDFSGLIEPGLKFFELQKARAQIIGKRAYILSPG